MVLTNNRTSFLLSGTGLVLGSQNSIVPQNKDLRDATFEKTIQSKLLATIKLKVSSLLFQLFGILSAGYSQYVIFFAADVHDWDTFKLAVFIFTQHSACITLIVATAQVAIFARYSAGQGEKALWSVVLLMCLIECFPCSIGIISMGWYGFLVYLILPSLLGISFVVAVGILLAFLGDPLSLVPREKNPLDRNPSPLYGGRSGNDVFDYYHSKGLVAKGLYQVTVLLPLFAASQGFTIFLITAYIVVMLVAVPIAWILMCGFEGVPVAMAILLEVIIPFLALISLAAKIAELNGNFLGRSGPNMILIFVLSQILVIFVSLLVPASILLQETNLGIRGALPMAYAKRHGATYSAAILNTFGQTLSKSEKHIEEIGLNATLAEGTLNAAQVAVSQLLALLG